MEKSAAANNRTSPKETTTAAKSDKKKLVTYVDRPLELAAATTLSKHELQLIFDARRAMKVYTNELTTTIVPIKSVLKALEYTPTLYANYAIQYCQHFPLFTKLSTNDQLTVLKSSSFYVQSIRGSMNYDIKRRAGLILVNQNESTYLEYRLIEKWINRVTIHRDLVDDEYRFLYEFQAMIGGDETLRDIVSVHSSNM